VGVAATLAIALGVGAFGKWLASTSLSQSEELQLVEKDISRDREQVENAAVVQHTAAIQEMLKWFKDAVPQDELIEYSKREDHESKLEFIRQELDADPGRGLAMLAYFLDVERPTRFFRTEASELLREIAGRDFGYDPEQGRGKNKVALREMRLELVKIQGTDKARD
jgi:hypothetical protein